MVISHRAGRGGGGPSLALDAARGLSRVFGVLGLIDLAFLASNALKIAARRLAAAGGGGRRLRGDGHLAAWAAASIWKRCATARWRWTCSWSAPTRCSQRIAGTAVFMSARSDVVPGALLHSLKHYKVLHERVVLATVTVGRHALRAAATPH